MSSVSIVSTGAYLPNKAITNQELAKDLDLTEQEIVKKSGIEVRYKVEEESIEELAIKATKKLLEKTSLNPQEIGGIFVATTTTNRLMPGISFYIQKELKIEKAICLDILAGCSGYINAFDLATSYLAQGKIKYALVIGVEVLSQYLDKKDSSTFILFGDGAGATLLAKTQEPKQYYCHLESNGNEGDILTLHANQTIKMNGKAIYKYAITDTVRNVQELLKETKQNKEEIKYIIPHQSNLRIIEKIAQKLEIPQNKVYTNIKEVGNTFCASIPIALEEMMQKGLLQPNDKIIMLGYGGGLNLGSILLEV